MLCAITHIRNYISDHSDSDNRKQSNSVIKTLSHAFSEDELHFTLDLFWTEYTYFDNNNGSFDVVEFIQKIKDIRYGNSNFCHHNYSLPCTKVLGFLSGRVTSKVIGIGGDSKTKNTGKGLISVLESRQHQNRLPWLLESHSKKPKKKLEDENKEQVRTNTEGKLKKKGITKDNREKMLRIYTDIVSIRKISNQRDK